jgi:DNA-directed RNA polymerase subunit N (RpoN/RPB10)
MLPIRCFSCGKVIADGKYVAYCERVARGENKRQVLDDLGLKRYCCRRMYTTHYDPVRRLERYDLEFPDDALEKENRRKRRLSESETPTECPPVVRRARV